MTILKNNKGVILFYLVVVVCVFMIFERVEQLNKNSEVTKNQIVYNINQK